MDKPIKHMPKSVWRLCWKTIYQWWFHIVYRVTCVKWICIKYKPYNHILQSSIIHLFVRLRRRKQVTWFYYYFHILMTKHRVQIDNSIYRTLIALDYKWLQHFCYFFIFRELQHFPSLSSVLYIHIFIAW
jgi:hypothetical protein